MHASESGQGSETGGSGLRLKIGGLLHVCIKGSTANFSSSYEAMRTRRTLNSGTPGTGGRSERE